MSVCAIDPSLECTGLARIHPDGTVETARVKVPTALDGEARFEFIVRAVVTWCRGAYLVAIEGPAYSRQSQAGHFDTSGLWRLIKQELWRLGVAVVKIEPQHGKMYATGNGGASKDDVLGAAIRTLGLTTNSKDEADALAMATMLADRLGYQVASRQLPDDHRRALLNFRLAGEDVTDEDLARTLGIAWPLKKPSRSKAAKGSQRKGSARGVAAAAAEGGAVQPAAGAVRPRRSRRAASDPYAVKLGRGEEQPDLFGVVHPVGAGS